MLNATTIAKAIVERLKNAPDLQDTVAIVRDDYLNENPSATPWIGVYTNSLSVEPFTLGQGPKSWRGTVNVDIACQHSAPASGEETRNALDDLVNNVLTALFADKTYGDAVAATMRYDISYDARRTDSETLDFQMATISLTMELRV